MTATTTNTTITELQSTWVVLFPHCPPPDTRQWAMWLTLHGEDVVRRGVAKLARRYENTTDLRHGESLHKFASVVMSSLSRQKQVAA